MMSKATHSSKNPIPDDFDPEKYCFREDFTLWMRALARRVAVNKDIEFLDELQPRNSRDDYSESHSILYSALRLDCQNKVMDLISEPIPVNEKPSEAFEIGVACSKSNGEEGWYPPVDGGSDCPYFTWKNELADRESYLKKHKPIVDTTVYDGGIWPTSTFRALISPEKVSLQVNLFYNDDVLCRSFSEWLKETRETEDFPTAKKTVVNLKNLKNWHRMRVLPYMDLWLYEQVFDVQFDREDIANCLFENDSDGDRGMDYLERLDRTKERAEALILPSVFFSLRYKET